MAQKRKRRSARNSRSSAEYPGWLYGLFGLAVGLSVAAAVWFSDRRAIVVTEPLARTPASLENALDDNGESAPVKIPPGPEEAPEETSRFEFYEMLPSFEVVVPEQDTEVTQDNEPRAVVQPGTYVLQAGSFTTNTDADRRRAELALQGIESNIQQVTIDGKTYHRVRIGPTDNLEELNLLRSRLRAAQIDVLRIRLGD